MRNRVKEVRLAKKKSQTEMAKFCGVSRQSIHSIEAQKLRPTVYLAIMISKFLELTVEELFQVEEV